MNIHPQQPRPARTLGFIAGVCALWAVANTSPAAQTPPPVTGTMALEGTMQKFYKGTNLIIVKTIDGVEHVFTITRDLIVHGGKAPGPGALAGLREGSTVVVHYTANGARPAAEEIDPIGEDGLQITEGTVVRVSRTRKQITIRFDNGS